jgi:G:T-mismatch repair DNA endonuclease (very short patch repair protein)
MLTTEQFVERVRVVHGTKYDYTLVDYRGAKVKVVILCPIHGKFSITPDSHMAGSGCPHCGLAQQVAARTMTGTEFTARGVEVHGEGTYDYSRVVYGQCGDDLVEILCPKHGSFWQSPGNHIYNAAGCPSCTHRYSAPHKEIESFLDTLGIVYRSNDRKQIHPFELDIYIPSHKLAIEFNGKYWHSIAADDSPDKKFKHRDKYRACIAKGITLLQIDEQDWMDETKRLIWQSVIRSKLGLHRKVHARKTEFRAILKPEADAFLDANHLQGSTPAVRWAFGLFLGTDLVGVLTFAKHEKTLLNLSRLAFLRDMTVVGGAQKLFRNALKVLPQKGIVTFSNSQYSLGGVYGVLGFKLDSELPPSYRWLFRNKVWDKRQMRHSHLPDVLGEDYDPSLTEHQNMFRAGARCLYDAGYQRWVYPRVT